MCAWDFHSRSLLCHQVKQSQEWKLGVLASTTAPWQVELVLLSTCIVVYLCCCLLVLSSTCIVIYLCCCLSFVFFEFSSVCGYLWDKRERKRRVAGVGHFQLLGAFLGWSGPGQPFSLGPGQGGAGRGMHPWWMTHGHSAVDGIMKGRGDFL